MDGTSLLLAPVTVPLRLARALDDLSAVAARARRQPDPVEEVRGRIDELLLEVDELIGVVRELVDGGADLRDATASLEATARVLVREADEIEDSASTVAETLGPLQGPAEKLDRVTKRFG